MSKTSIFYYTNNVIPPKLLKYTFHSVIDHCKKNNCELIVTSHYPITEKYEEHKLSNLKQPIGDIYKHIVNKPLISESDTKGINLKCYVVGYLPYSHESIIKQILFSSHCCSGENIILMEHDCLYPERYIATVESWLSTYNLTYCSFNIVFLNDNGYFNIENGSFVLSTCSFKRDVLQGVYEKKLELIKNSIPYAFEPLLDIHSNQKKDMYKNEIIIKKHLCIDTFLGNQCPLDIKHHLNADGMLSGDNYYHDHPYWKNDKTYLEMIKTKNINSVWNYGICKFNY